MAKEKNPGFDDIKKWVPLLQDEYWLGNEKTIAQSLVRLEEAVNLGITAHRSDDAISKDFFETHDSLERLTPIMQKKLQARIRALDEIKSASESAQQVLGEIAHVVQARYIEEVLVSLGADRKIAQKIVGEEQEHLAASQPIFSDMVSMLASYADKAAVAIPDTLTDDAAKCQKKWRPEILPEHQEMEQFAKTLSNPALAKPMLLHIHVTAIEEILKEEKKYADTKMQGLRKQWPELEQDGGMGRGGGGSRK